MGSCANRLLSMMAIRHTICAQPACGSVSHDAIGAAGMSSNLRGGKLRYEQ